MEPSPTVEASLEAEQVTRSLANELMSPYCPGRTISSCPSPNARKLEDFILTQASEGKSKGEIESMLVEEFGREKLGSKHSPALVYAAAGSAVLAAVLVGMAARRWLRPTPASGPGGSAPAGLEGVGREELDRLEDALDDIDEIA